MPPRVPPGSREPSSLRAAEPPSAARQTTQHDPLAAWTPALSDAERRPLISNLALRSSRRAPDFDPAQQAALLDLIAANGLDEASSPSDYDDGDGRFDPWELGFQLWQDGQLVLLALGPDPYASFDYRLHEVPPSIAALDSLELLDLSRSQLLDLPYEIGALRSLRDLRLTGNALRSLPASVGDLARLERLTLSRNRLTELPASLGQLSQLRELWLADNSLALLPPEVGELPALRALDLSHADTALDGAVTGLRELPDFRRATSLESLYLANNRFCSDAALRALDDGSHPRLYGLGQQRCSD
jgi:hypothetical protein